jgi:tetratricopeptide (TPR) repeat protein
MTPSIRVLCLLLASASRAIPAQSAAEHLALGDSAYREFDAAVALGHYETAISLDSANVEALGKASRTAVDLGEAETNGDRKATYFTTGLTFARRAVAADSNNAESWFHLGRALGRRALSVGVRDRVRFGVEVRDAAQRALAISPDHPGALHVLGMWHAEVKRLNGFELFFARNFLGGRILGEAIWADAVAHLERAAAIDPDRLSHHLDLAGIYVDVGEKEKARASYQRVLDATTRTDVNDPLYKRQAEEALGRLR